MELYANRETSSYRDNLGLKDPNVQSPPMSVGWRACRGKAIIDGKGFGRLKIPQVGVTKWFHLGPHVSENLGSFLTNPPKRKCPSGLCVGKKVTLEDTEVPE